MIFRPYGDYWEVYNNARGHTSVIYHYKGIDDRRRIIFWVIGPDHKVSNKSEYRTGGR